MIRTLFRSDILFILELEKAVHIAPWTKEAFEMCFRSGYAGWVIEEDKQVLAFIIVSFQRQECHILNLAVKHQAQRQGFGRSLMEHALKQAKMQGIGIAYLEVRRSNSRAISLYRHMDFQLVGERKNYYPTLNGMEDALVFAKSLVEEFP